jgi:L-fuconolactonase
MSVPVPAARASDPATWTDAHLHLWDSARLAPPWLAQAPAFAGRFDHARYLAEGGVRGGIVLVEADVAPADRAREARLLAEWGEASGGPFAVVAGIEPGAEDFARELEEVAAAPRVVGARRVLHGGDIPFTTAAFDADLRVLGARGLSFDLCVRWTDLAPVESLAEELARAAPATTLVLDHLGNPPLRAGWDSPERASWQRLVARIAAFPNVSVKWSAMFENAGRAVTAAEARPWFEWCLARFGPTRLMWGSNWPVCFAESSLARWIEVAAELAGELGVDEQAAILGANARRTYPIA